MASKTITVTVAGTDYTATNPGGRGQGNNWTVPALGLTVQVPRLKWPGEQLWQVGGDVLVGSATGLVVYRVTTANGVYDVRWVGNDVAQSTSVYVGSNNGDLWNEVHLDWRRRVITDKIADKLAAEAAGDVYDDAVGAVESVSNPRRTFGTSLTAEPTVRADRDALLQSIARIRAYKSGGKTAPYQFLVLMWAISRARSGEARLVPFDDVKDELLEILSSFRVAETEPDPVDPWYALRNTDWWELSSPIPATFDDVRRLNTPAGLRQSVYELVSQDAAFAEQALAMLTARIDNAPDQQYALVDLGLSAAVAPDGGAVGLPSHESVPVENSFTEQFTAAYEAMAAAERTRREATIQRNYQKHLEAQGHTVTRKRIIVDGQTLYSDLYDEDTDDLIEVKSVSDRVTMRLALGQILDYAFIVKPAILTVVVPKRPTEGIIHLYQKHSVRVVWPNAYGEFDFENT